MTIRVTFNANNLPVASCEVSSLPGNGQVAVFHHNFVSPLLRGKGWGKTANNWFVDHMKNELLYNYAICTVEASNLPQLIIMEKCGWKKLDQFISSKTGNEVILFGRGL